MSKIILTERKRPTKTTKLRINRFAVLLAGFLALILVYAAKHFIF